jgi:hypothetical protein
MSDCVDVCDFVVEKLDALGFVLDHESEDHADMLAALAQVDVLRQASDPAAVDESLPTSGSVELIAAAYEWLCPMCDRYNRVIAVPSRERVQCAECARVYSVHDYHHALED